MRRKVVVVDDDLSIVQMVRLHLEAHYYVVACLDPLDALMQCESGDVSAMITDWHMPAFTGLEILEVLRQKHPAVRRVLLTAAPGEPEVREAQASGLVEVLIEKPWSRAEMLSALAALLASHLQ